MPHIQSCDLKTELESGSSYHQVLNSNHDAPSRLLSFDSPGEPRYIKGHRMNNKMAEHALGEQAPSFPVCISSCPIHPVRELDRANRGERYVHFAIDRARSVQDTLDRFSSPFAGNQDASVQKKSQEINPTSTGPLAAGCE
jgi:hypothetical protein